MPGVIYLLNGPNMNLLGHRQPDVYGRETLADAEALCRDALPEGFELRAMQSNHEGQIVDWIHEARGTAAGIVINAGAYSHTSIAILDALNAFEGPVVEVHVSNIYRRESFRHHSHISARADAVIAGFGVGGYVAAVRRVAVLAGGPAAR